MPELPGSVREILSQPERLAVLDALELDPNARDSDFERITRTAAHVFNTPYALITLVDDQVQRFHACFGIDDMTQTEVQSSFCAYTLATRQVEPVVVPDLAQDERFKANRFVVGEPFVRFYAGVPIVVQGQSLGTLCVLDTAPRHEIAPALLEQLSDLAGLAATLFALKDEAKVRARTAAALIREEWRHALSLEAGKVGSWVWDIESGEVACNDMFRRIHGLSEFGPVTATEIIQAIDADDREAVEAGLRASLTAGEDFEAEARVAGSERWLAMRGRVYQRDASGHPLVMMGASMDVTQSKQSADQTRLLLRELNHRVKNTLAMIQSVARQTIRQNPDPQDFLDAFTGRLRTISDAHVLLANRDWSGVQLYEVLASQLGPNWQSKPDRAVVKGPDVHLPPDHALGLGLVLHELTTNAHRHGAWSTKRGVVHIDWDIVDEPQHGLLLHWRESGGPLVHKPDEYGLGAKLIERSLTKVLDSDVALRFEPTGVSTRVWMPLADEDGERISRRQY